tara:strand:- start:344 stop:469 length:126 start_codon:yes stop_codon:yes gene_type:complete
MKYFIKFLSSFVTICIILNFTGCGKKSMPISPSNINQEEEE